MMERRNAQIEVHARGRRLAGHAALFGVEARIADSRRGAFRETIAVGAFKRSLTNDVLALRDHDAGRVLGRTKSGTLRLAEDARGLAFELDVPDTTEGRDVLALADRGDLGGMSFGFDVPAGGDAWSGDRRELRAINLYEISIVAGWPAYPGTSVEARSGLYAARPGLEAARRWLATL